MEQLLSTKLFIPLNRPELVPRTRIIDRYLQAFTAKLP